MFELIPIILYALIALSNLILSTYGAFPLLEEMNRINKNININNNRITQLIHSKTMEMNGKSSVYFESSSKISPSLNSETVLQKIRRRRNAVIDPRRRWPNGIVPYEIDQNFNKYEQYRIKTIFEKFHKYTCVRFIPHTTEADYIFIEGEGKLSWSSVGRVGGKQFVNLPPLYLETDGVPIHELMHSLGFWHEQNRPDRDQYIKVQLRNINPFYIPNFRKNKVTDTFQLPYDFNSVMHYSGHAFSRNGHSTIIPLTPYRDEADHLGQRKGFSYLDIKKLNRMYCPRRKSGVRR